MAEQLLRHVQAGEEAYKMEDLKEAIGHFEKALKEAENNKEQANINICKYNLAAVYAASQENRKTKRLLGELSNDFIVTNLQDGGSQKAYLSAIAAKTMEKRALAEALDGIQDCGRSRFLLENLIELEEISRQEQIKYLKKLAKVYAVQQEHLKRLRVMCRRARLLYLEKEEEDSLQVLEIIEREYDQHFSGHDDAVSATTSKCQTVAKKHHQKPTVNQEELVFIWNEVGLLYTQLKKHSDALTWFGRALELLSNSDNGTRAKLYQNIGACWLLRARNEQDFQNALKCSQQAIDFINQLENESDKKRLAECYLNKGQAYLKLKKRSCAISAFIKATLTTDKRTQAQAHETLADCALDMNESSCAEEHLKKSLVLTKVDKDRERILDKLVRCRGRTSRTGTRTMTITKGNLELPKIGTGKTLSSANKTLSSTSRYYSPISRPGSSTFGCGSLSSLSTLKSSCGSPNDSNSSCRNCYRRLNRCTGTGRELGQCYINIGFAEFMRDNLDKAHTAYNEAKATGCEEDNKEIQCKAYEGLGTIAAARNDYKTSTMNFTTAIRLLDMEISTVEVTSLRNRIAEKLANLHEDRFANLDLRQSLAYQRL